MNREIKSNILEVKFFEGLVDIEHIQDKNIAIEITRVEPGAPLVHEGAVYEICVYRSEAKGKVKPSDYGIAWVMNDGSIIGRSGRRC